MTYVTYYQSYIISMKKNCHFKFHPLKHPFPKGYSDLENLTKE